MLWLLSSNELSVSDLWLNLLAGFIASICTIAVIDNIIKRQKKEELLPILISQYREIQLFTSRLIGFWSSMYASCIKTNQPVSTDDLFSSISMEKVYQTLDLEGKANVTPEVNWFTNIEYNRNDLDIRGNQILNRYLIYCDPQVFRSIHHTIHDSAFIGRLQITKSIRTYDLQNQFPRVPILQQYSTLPSEEDYKQIKILFTWCRNIYSELSSKADIYPITEIAVPANTKPSSFINDQKIEALNAVYQERYIKKTKTTNN